MEIEKKELAFCNNCGMRGHTFNYCEHPIVSIGIVSFKIVSGVAKFLMICRKDSLGFIDFVRGKYPLYNRVYIQELINEMTNTEKELLLNKNFNEIWKHLWGNYQGLQFRAEDKYACDKFEQIRRGINNNKDEQFCLKTLIENSPTNWDEPEWGFPKGRKNYKEPDIKCAFREFQEETGYLKDELDIVSNIIPIEEIFMGSNYKIYKHKYYIAKFLGDMERLEFQKTEVSDMRWLSYEECIKMIRPYNVEKKNVLKNINNIIHQYRLIS